MPQTAFHTGPTPHAPADSRVTELTGDALRHRALAAVAPLHVVSTLPFTKTPFWDEAVHTEPERWRGRGIAGLLSHIRGMLAAAADADVVLVNGGERADLLYLAVAGLCPWIRAPHQINDAHWHAKGGMAGRLQRLILRLGRRLIDEVQPHSPEEVELYAHHFGLPRECIRPLPWSTSLQGYDIRRADPHERIIVSGGHSYRDYPTLFEAVRRGGWTLEVGLPPSPATEQALAHARGAPNIRVVGDWRIGDYWQKVANAHVFAMPIVPGLTRCTADQTLLNAMSFGTVVVATDALSSRLYIRHGVNGFLVPEGDADAWQSTLEHVFSLPEAAYRAIGAQAAADVARHHGEADRLARTLLRAADGAARRPRRTAAAEAGTSR